MATEAPIADIKWSKDNKTPGYHYLSRTFDGRKSAKVQAGGEEWTRGGRKAKEEWTVGIKRGTPKHQTICDVKWIPADKCLHYSDTMRLVPEAEVVSNKVKHILAFRPSSEDDRLSLADKRSSVMDKIQGKAKGKDMDKGGVLNGLAWFSAGSHSQYPGFVAVESVEGQTVTHKGLELRMRVVRSEADLTVVKGLPPRFSCVPVVKIAVLKGDEIDQVRLQPEWQLIERTSSKLHRAFLNFPTTPRTASCSPSAAPSPPVCFPSPLPLPFPLLDHLF